MDAMILISITVILVLFFARKMVLNHFGLEKYSNQTAGIQEKKKCWVVRAIWLTFLLIAIMILFFFYADGFDKDNLDFYLVLFITIPLIWIGTAVFFRKMNG
jgi:hypothetical protein